MQADKKDVEKIQSIIESEEMNSYIGEYQKEYFLICEDWEEHDKIFAQFEKPDHQIIEYGFSDEYTTCGGCGKIIHLIPSYYGDIPQHMIINDCELLCADCIEFDDMENTCKNNPENANKLYKFNQDEFIKHGYIKLNNEGYENGLHKGMNDDPKKIFAQFEKEYNSIIFSIDETSQFYMTFSAYGKNE